MATTRNIKYYGKLNLDFRELCQAWSRIVAATYLITCIARGENICMYIQLANSYQMRLFENSQYDFENLASHVLRNPPLLCALASKFPLKLVLKLGCHLLVTWIVYACISNWQIMNDIWLCSVSTLVSTFCMAYSILVNT